MALSSRLRSHGRPPPVTRPRLRWRRRTAASPMSTSPLFSSGRSATPPEQMLLVLIVLTCATRIRRPMRRGHGRIAWCTLVVVHVARRSLAVPLCAASALVHHGATALLSVSGAPTPLVVPRTAPLVTLLHSPPIEATAFCFSSLLLLSCVVARLTRSL